MSYPLNDDPIAPYDTTLAQQNKRDKLRLSILYTIFQFFSTYNISMAQI